MSHDSITLSAEERQVIGKRLRKLRESGKVPAVVHDHGNDSVIIETDYNPLEKVVHKAGKHHLVSLTVAGKGYNTIIKDVSFDPRTHTITHVVFNAVKANERIETAVPVHARYAEGNDSSPAERTGLIVLHNAETIEIEALPKDLPDVLYFDAEQLHAAGDQATAGDVILPSGVTLKTEADHVIATVFEPSALAAANDAAGGDTEEVSVTEESVDGQEETTAA